MQIAPRWNLNASTDCIWPSDRGKEATRTRFRRGTRVLCTQADACGDLSASLLADPRGSAAVESNRNLPRGRFPRASQGTALALLPSANLSGERRESLWHTGSSYVWKLPCFFHVEDSDDDHPIHGRKKVWNTVRNLPRGRREPACS
jgi:hypothetical protein